MTDTAGKRGSALNVGSPWRGILPAPDGAVGSDDRAVVPFLYSGISAGAPVTVPDVVGQTEAAGTATLQGDGFVVSVDTAYSSAVAAGLIISQDPIGGATAGLGSVVTITVSLGEQARGGSSRRRRGKRPLYWWEAQSKQREEAVPVLPKVVAPKVEFVSPKIDPIEYVPRVQFAATPKAPELDKEKEDKKARHLKNIMAILKSIDD